ncbi:putative methyltransferase-domain-containing protein [Sparassis latifolia]
MFFYLSFLRPPPLQTSPSGSISITPQIANDLRTELFAGEQDIYYAWSADTPPNGRASTFPCISKPQKLTTWRKSSAYKELAVPLPPGIREGQSFRLVLTAHSSGNPHVVNLAGATLGERPFPVLSMPILFSSRLSAKAGSSTMGKQEQVERVYRIAAGSGDQLFLHVKEQTSFDLDKKVWDSGIGLSSWIASLAQARPSDSAPLVDNLLDILMSREPRNIVELGAGTGIVSLTVGALRAAIPSSSNGGCILTTDLPMPLLVHNIAANEALFRSTSTRPRALVLDWDDEQLPNEVSAVVSDLDLILMADVTYNTSSFPSLVRTLSALTGAHREQAGDETGIATRLKSPSILLGYKERDSSERILWNMVREIGIVFEQVGERVGSGGEAVEFWIGHVSR